MSDAVVGKALRRCAEAVARLGDGGIPTTCVRLFSGRADGCDGVLVDRLGALVVATDYRGPGTAARPGGQGDSARRLLELVQGVYGDVPIVVKARGHEKGSESFVCIRSLPPLLAPPDEPAAAVASASASFKLRLADCCVEARTSSEASRAFFICSTTALLAEVACSASLRGSRKLRA